ncbi:MAG: hypothetical protein F8N36_14100 [Desulfovibrio sp.]|uniref:exodeoxyribonuclease VII large subunit n=1 Tax=Desulfovibrio sp. TaxID=885 RepID=UPI00135DFCF2|nr:exodeoxyribonuclease VII large subunit [Desulfovibrio sp.]MTJ93971.1 hypothetical protein [Desulfovibrio sp.]
MSRSSTAAGQVMPTSGEPVAMRILTVAALNETFAQIAANVVRRTKELEWLIQLEGDIGDLGAKKGSWHYDVPLSDPRTGAAVLCNVPADLVAGHDVREGHHVRVVGRADANCFRDVARFRLTIIDLATVSAPEEQEVERSTLAALKQLSNGRRSFPSTTPISVTIIGPSGSRAKGGIDMAQVLSRDEASVMVDQVDVRMGDPVAMANVIRETRSDVLALVRGGGDTKEFSVFDNLAVIEALSLYPGYRVIGLGHEGDRTLAELFVDHAAITPSDAGHHVLSRIRENEEAAAAARRTSIAQKTADEMRERAAIAETKLTETEGRAKSVEDRFKDMSQKVQFGWSWLLLAALAGLGVGYFVR